METVRKRAVDVERQRVGDEQQYNSVVLHSELRQPLVLLQADCQSYPLSPGSVAVAAAETLHSSPAFQLRQRPAGESWTDVARALWTTWLRLGGLAQQAVVSGTAVVALQCTAAVAPAAD